MVLRRRFRLGWPIPKRRCVVWDREPLRSRIPGKFPSVQICAPALFPMTPEVETWRSTVANSSGTSLPARACRVGSPPMRSATLFFRHGRGRCRCVGRSRVLGRALSAKGPSGLSVCGMNGEHLTYLLLQHLGLSPRVVPEGRERQPDLSVEIAGVEVPVEVKTFERNQQEREVADEKSASVSQEIGRRLIKQLSKARGQVRAAAEAGRPSLVIVLDPSSLGHAWPDHIAAAFVGHLTAEVELEDGHPVVRDVQRHENRRRVPPGSLRDISAVGVLHSCLTTSPFLQRLDTSHTLAFNLEIYHNPDALVPFSGDLLTLGVAEYRIGNVRSRTAYASLR